MLVRINLTWPNGCTPSISTSALGNYMTRGKITLNFQIFCLAILGSISCIVALVFQTMHPIAIFAVFSIGAYLHGLYCNKQKTFKTHAHFKSIGEICLPNIRVMGIALLIFVHFCFISSHAEAQVYTSERIKVEEISGKYYKIGTKDELVKFALSKSLKNKNEIRKQINLAYYAITNNVEGYLDWYYTLTSEYLRTLNLLAGNHEEYLERKLEEYLLSGDPFYQLEITVDNIAYENIKHSDEYKAILQQNFIQKINYNTQTARRFEVVERWNEEIDESLARELIRIKNIANEIRTLLFSRGAAAAAGSGVSGAIAKKVSGSGVFAIAAIPLGKLIATKALGAAGGAATGAVACSFIPFIGTAICAVVGGVLGGIAGGVAIDKAITEVGELINRDEFRIEILNAISVTKSEMIYQFDL